MMDRGSGGDVKTVVLGAFQRGQGTGGGDLIRVVLHAGHLDQGDVAIQPHTLGHG